MGQYLVKILITSVVVVAVSEIARRSSLWAAALASLPLTSLLAFVWLYVETGDVQSISSLSRDIFWLVLPSLVLFLLLPRLLELGWGFWMSLGISCAATALFYVVMVWILSHTGKGSDLV